MSSDFAPALRELYLIILAYGKHIGRPVEDFFAPEIDITNQDPQHYKV